MDRLILHVFILALLYCKGYCLLNVTHNSTLDICYKGHIDVTRSPLFVSVNTTLTNRTCEFTVLANHPLWVEVSHSSSLNTALSYAVIENIDEQMTPVWCQSKPVRNITVGSRYPCALLATGSSMFRFYLSHVKIDLKIIALSDYNVNQCPNDNIVVDGAYLVLSHALKCNVSEFESIMSGTLFINHFRHVYDTHAYHWGTYPLRLLCPTDCLCSLGDSQWNAHCQNGYVTNTLIVYPASVFLGLFYSNTGIRQISREAFQSINQTILFELVLARNEIEVVPHDLFYDLVRISDIDLSYNRIKSLSVELFLHSEELCIVKFAGNQLSDFPVGLFKTTVNLTALDISYNQFSTWPSSLNNNEFLSAVTWLTVESNFLREIPIGALQHFSNLKFASFWNNSLIQLPTGLLEGLSQISFVDLAENDLTSLHGGIFDTPDVEVWDYNQHILYSNLDSSAYDALIVDGIRLGLDIGSNFIRTIDGDTFSKCNLTNLYLEDNLLTEIPVGLFTNIAGLEVIDFNGNYLATLPVRLFDDQINLSYLDLHGNILTQLFDGIFDFQFNLTSCILSHNRLAQLPENVFHSMTKLSLLNIAYNLLQDLPGNIFQSLYQLRKLDLIGNRLNVLSPETLRSLYLLDYLRMSNNEVMFLESSLFNTTSQLTALTFRHNSLLTIAPGTFSNLIQLENLDLSNNDIRDIPYNALSSLHYLDYLNLTRNALSRLPSFEETTNLTILDLSWNNVSRIDYPTFAYVPSLVFLTLANNMISTLHEVIFNGLVELIVIDLSYNKVQEITSGLFRDQSQLNALYLDGNLIVELTSNVFQGLGKLQYIGLQQNQLSRIHVDAFTSVDRLEYLDLSHNDLNNIGAGTFEFSINMDSVDLRGNGLHVINKESFIGLEKSTILVDEYATCCFKRDGDRCISENPQAVYLTCKRMLPQILVRVSMWCLGATAILSNGLAFISRRKSKQTPQTVLIAHLSLSDFIMGINMVLLAFSDVYYGEYFPSYSNWWREGAVCQFAGVLSILSSEASVFFITLISIDRMLGVKYPFSSRRMTLKSSKVWSMLLWFVALSLSIVPTSLSKTFPDAFEVSEVCIGIPMVKRPVAEVQYGSQQLNKTEFGIFYDYSSYYGYFLTAFELKEVKVTDNISFLKTNIIHFQIATYFSIIVFIGLNLVCFILVAYCYVQIIYTAKMTAKRASRNQSVEEEIRMAVKTSTLVMTDFCCWVPLTIVCILAQSGLIDVPPELYAWTVGFILPINSSVNPFLYTLSTVISDYFDKKRKAKNAGLPLRNITVKSLSTGIVDYLNNNNKES